MKNKFRSFKFTGERMIPEFNKGKAFFYEHIIRYFIASRYIEGKVVLDAACGSGYGSHIMSKHGSAKKIISVDIDQQAIEYAKTKYSAQNIDFFVSNLLDLNKISDNSIDVITAFEIIEHIDDQENF